jgi:single-strand DNA-binding protein
MARSLNCVQLIGNLTRDPELRYTGNGKPVCDIGLATNRQWKTESGEKKEETEFHKIVLWGKLAEIASQYLRKGMKAYFQGRIQTRSYTGADGTLKFTTEIIAEDMLMLSGDPSHRKAKEPPVPQPTHAPKPKAEQEATNEQPGSDQLNVEPDEIPF